MQDLPTPPRSCQYCGRPLVKRNAEDEWGWRKRRFCGYRGANLFRCNGPSPGDPRCQPRAVSPPEADEVEATLEFRDPIPTSFPGARSDSIDGAPARCPRCDGPWFLDVGALACRLCGQRWYITELMRGALRRLAAF